MGACLGKPAAHDGKGKGGSAPHEDLVFANEKSAAAALASTNGAGSVPAASAAARPGSPDFGGNRQQERGNFAYESPAMSVQGTPLIHLPNFAPAPANLAAGGSILQQAAEQAKASRLRDHARGGEGSSTRGGSDSDDGDYGVGVDKDGKPLDKRFGYQRNIGMKYELEHELGRGHFGHTCLAIGKKGEVKGKECAIKIIPKANMSTAIAVEDVKREIKILRSLSGHNASVKFYDAFEDQLNVYIAMELCTGGELLEHLLRRGGRYSEPEAKVVIRQILSSIAFCHQQGVVHRDLKPENFLFASSDETTSLRVIDFGLSDFIKPDQKMNDIVGSAYYIAPEVLHRSYATEADVWSIGVICYILLSGARPFWAKTESGIFRSVLRMEPNFQDNPWPSVSHPAREFVHWMLTKDYRRRPTAAQALSHPWIRSSSVAIPLDMVVFRSLRNFFTYSSLRQSGLRAVVPTLTEDELIYLRSQYAFFDTNKDNSIDFNDLKHALNKVATEAMKESHSLDVLKSIEAARVKGMNFDEFCAATVNIFQLEALPNWAERARLAYQAFIKSGKGNVTIDALIKELGQNESVTNAAVLQEWTNYDGTISFLGFTRLIHGPSRARNRARSNKAKAHATMASSHDPMNSIPEDGSKAA